MPRSKVNDVPPIVESRKDLLPSVRDPDVRYHPALITSFRRPPARPGSRELVALVADEDQFLLRMFDVRKGPSQGRAEKRWIAPSLRERALLDGYNAQRVQRTRDRGDVARRFFRCVRATNDSSSVYLRRFRGTTKCAKTTEQ